MERHAQLHLTKHTFSGAVHFFVSYSPFFQRAVLITVFERISSHSFKHNNTSFIMKYSYTLLTLISASMVVAAPAPFVGTGPVVAAGTENVVIPTTSFERREVAAVQDFGKRALRLRGALLAARGGKGNADVQDEAAANAAQGKDKGKDAAVAEGAQAKDQGKNVDAQAGECPRNTQRSGRSDFKIEQAAADQQNAHEAAAGMT